MNDSTQHWGAPSMNSELQAYQHGITEGIKRTLHLPENVLLSPLELELLSLVLADYLDNLDPSLDTKLLHIFQKIKSLNNYFKGV